MPPNTTWQFAGDRFLASIESDHLYLHQAGGVMGLRLDGPFATIAVSHADRRRLQRMHALTAANSFIGVDMPKFNVQVPHTLSKSEAHERLNHFVDILRQKFQDSVSDLDQSWEDDTLRFKFKTYGIQLQGGVTVADNALNVEGDIPFTAMMFKGKIESAIKEQLARLVGPTG